MLKRLFSALFVAFTILWLQIISVAQTPEPSPTSISTTQEPFWTPDMVRAVGQCVFIPLVIIVFIIWLREPLMTLATNIAKKSEHATEIGMKAPGTEFNLKTADSKPTAIGSIEKAEGKADDLDKELTKEKKSLDDEIPENEGGDKNYITKMFKAARERDLEALNECYKLAEKFEKNPKQIVRLKSAYSFLKFKLGDGNAIKELTELMESHKDSFYPPQALGVLYEESNDYEKAIDFLGKAASLADEESQCTSNILARCDCLVKIGNKQSAIEEAIKLIRILKENDNVAKALKKLSEICGDDELSALLLEKVVEFLPNDNTSIFDAAYALSNAEMKSLAVFKYVTLVSLEPEYSMAWNNLGVSYKSLGLSVYAVESYKTSCELGNSLSMCNLANMYSQAGFTDNADELIQKAKSIGGHDSNLAGAISSLSELQREQEKKRNEVLEVGLKQQQFFRRYIDALIWSDGTLPIAEGSWTVQSDHSRRLKNLEISLSVKRINIIYETSYGHYKLEGNIENSIASLTVYKLEKSLYSDKETFSSIGYGHLYVSRDATSLSILFLPKDTEDSLSFKGELVLQKAPDDVHSE